MTADYTKLLEAYWQTIEEDQNYRNLADFYSDESQLIDPVYGPFRGYDKIKAFLHKVTEDMAAAQVSFSVAETAAAGDIGWARWMIHFPDGSEKEGVSVYRFKDGKILYQRDYIGSNEL